MILNYWPRFENKFPVSELAEDGTWLKAKFNGFTNNRTETKKQLSREEVAEEPAARSRIERKRLVESGLGEFDFDDWKEGELIIIFGRSHIFQIYMRIRKEK